MGFGPIMRVPIDGGLIVELAPLSREVMGEFVSSGMQTASVVKYLSLTQAPTLEDEYEWYDKVRADKTNVLWGVYVTDQTDTRVLIGVTSLTHIERGHIHQATSGSVIFRKEYWGRGIASRIHMARTWYAFQHMGLHRIKSAVIQGNVASRRALEKSGYELVYVERNTNFVDGELRSQDCLECLNSSDAFWSQWWHGDRPPRRLIEARRRTNDALLWAKQHVELI